MKIVFLDIDGVLNGHDWDEGAMSTRIQYRCIKQLNRIIKATGCKFVLSSAWRYMLLSENRRRAPLTTKGFEYLMRTHGTCGFRLLGTTCSDEAMGWCVVKNPDVRGQQITKWLKDNLGLGITRYCAIDDCEFDIRSEGHPLVQTHPKWGLGRRTASEAIRVLNRESCAICGFPDMHTEMCDRCAGCVAR